MFSSPQHTAVNQNGLHMYCKLPGSDVVWSCLFTFLVTTIPDIYTVVVFCVRFWEGRCWHLDSIHVNHIEHVESIGISRQCFCCEKASSRNTLSAML